MAETIEIIEEEVEFVEEKQPRAVEDLSRAVEALIFVADEPISTRALADVLDEEKDLIESVVEELIESYDERKGGLQIRQIAATEAPNRRIQSKVPPPLANSLSVPAINSAIIPKAP